MLTFYILCLSCFSFSDSLRSEGWASYYHNRFQNRKTANGEIFDQKKLSAAHKTLAFGTLVRVENQNNGEWVVVRINDRLPKYSKRSIDLSRAAADSIKMIREGVVPVIMSLVSEGNWLSAPEPLIPYSFLPIHTDPYILPQENKELPFKPKKD
jgi:rare lipoprotein A